MPRVVNTFNFPRALIIYAIAIPLALVLGFFLIVPESGMTIGLIGLILFIFTLPFLIRWHHPALAVLWASYFNVMFLPGQPPVWMALAAASFGISVLNGILQSRRPFISVPQLTLPLLLLFGVVAFTGLYRGGIGARAFGGDAYGGKSYFYLLGAVIGYFALTGQRIQKKHAGLIVGLYLLGPATGLLANLVYAAGPSFYVFLGFFPIDLIVNQVVSDYYSWADAQISRIIGTSYAAVGCLSYLLARFGVSGVFDWRKPWRFLAMGLILVISMSGGFRSIVLLLGIIFLFMAFWEKMLKTRLFMGLIAAAVLAVVGLAAVSEHLPLTMQRALSFLPINVDPIVRQDATASTEWRLEMWKVLMPEIPQYLWIGKGYSIDPTDLYLTTEAVQHGMAKDYEPHIIAGSYHSGPLSTIIPIGLFGTLAFFWLLIAGGRVLYKNYKHGDPDLRRVNTFLLAYFCARVVFFIFIFGGFNFELYIFTGILGLSVSINGGVAKPTTSARRIPATAPITSSLQPASA